MYGAGFIRETADAKHMSDLLELPIEQSMKPQAMDVRWADADDPLLQGLRSQTLTVPGKPVPVFTIAPAEADGCRVLGRFTEGGKPAVAVRGEPTFSTVYAGTLSVPSALLRNCARKAGVFLYVETDEVIQTDGRWLVITATTAGPKLIYLPRLATVRDAMTGRKIGERIDRWDVELKQGETRLYEIE